MQLIIHRFNRLRELGLRKSMISMRNKLSGKLFYARWRSRAIARTASHTWPTIAHKHGITKDFSQFWHTVSLKSLPAMPRQNFNTLIAQAEKYVHNEFDILGSGPQKFLQIPWHEDIRLKAQNFHADYQFDKKSFYKDIHIQSDQTCASIFNDIKVPWELSRCQHMPILGLAYQSAHDERYAQTFTAHVTSWLDENSYLLGINWLCPMEVAIRAINWIWTFYYFKNCNAIPSLFWQRFTCSLYDHMHYLENNWEIFDTKTSNHYLSDLLGYLYLCWFFSDLPGINKKRDWCIKELLKEFDCQIAPDGTDYESSTAYHGLVAELFDHMVLLCKEMSIELPDSFHEKHVRMHEFIAWCKINDDEMVKIGDDDSGRITKINIPRYTVLKSDSTRDERKKSNLYVLNDIKRTDEKKEGFSTVEKQGLKTDVLLEKIPYKQTTQKEMLLPPFIPSVLQSKMYRGTGKRDNYKHFPNFGISILKTNPWHLTLRHHAYQKEQPSAHFHNDFLSVTLAVNGIPVFVDPGSYLYTASPSWRNHFRSASAHNTFYVDGHEPIPFDDRLFALNIPEAKAPSDFGSCHNLYARFGLTLQRAIEWNDQKIIIIDSWNKPKHELSLAWNFTLHPDIQLIPDGNQWILAHNNKPLLAMHSALKFQSHQTWVSPEYGVKKESMCLKTRYLATVGNESTISFIKL